MIWMAMNARGGQAMVEYVLALATLLVVCLIMWGLVKTAFRYADRTENLVSSEYP